MMTKSNRKSIYGPKRSWVQVTEELRKRHGINLSSVRVRILGKRAEEKMRRALIGFL